MNQQIETARKTTWIAILFVLILLASMWLTSQGGILPAEPGAFAASLYLVITSLPVLIILWLSAAGFGAALRQHFNGPPATRFVWQLGMGMAILLLLWWVAAYCGWINPLISRLVCATGLLILFCRVIPRLPSSLKQKIPHHPSSWMCLAAAPAIGIMLIAATCPPGTLWRIEAFGYDALSYHLQLPREWLATGQMSGFEHQVYSFMPNLIESAYLLIFSLLNTSGCETQQTVYTCQLFHCSLAVFMMIGLVHCLTNSTGKSIAWLAGSTVISLPWIIITAGLPYNEMGMLAFAITAMLMIFNRQITTIPQAMLLGVLLGATTMAKLTAGPMLAVPILLLVLLIPSRRDNNTTLLRTAIRIIPVAATLLILTLSPYLLRNLTQTGNPVFPFMTHVWGTGHWSNQLASRWNYSHGLTGEQTHRLQAFREHWLQNRGYGAVAGEKQAVSNTDIAHFQRTNGVPVFWLAAGIGGFIALINRKSRTSASALLAALLLQLLFWLYTTHLQSRFLLPTIIPAAFILAIGWKHPARYRPLITCGLLALLPLTLAWLSLRTMLNQTVPLQSGEPAPVWLVIDSLAPHEQLHTPLYQNAANNHPINELPENSRVYIVADNQKLFYLCRPFTYHSPFDHSPLGEWIRSFHHNSHLVTAALKSAGYTHVWINHAELDRLHQTYGYDANITTESLHKTAYDWHIIDTFGPSAVLYELPENTNQYEAIMPP